MRLPNTPLIGTVVSLALLACSSDPPPPDDPGSDESITLTGDFVAVPREADTETMARRQQALELHGMPQRALWNVTSRDFYLAIHKDALEDTWFLSAFLQQYFPGGVNGGAAASLGTRVVSFRIQNDRLYVFDVDDRKASSDVFDPDVLVEAYPIITGFKRFEILPGARDYVLIDPSAGLNRFGVVGDAFGSGLAGGDYYPHRFQVELSFLQRFRKIDDGITYEHIFTGYSDDFLPTNGGVEPNYFRASGTIGVALRRYSEGTNYTQVEMPWQEHYFRSEPFIERDVGFEKSVAAHWDLYPGMEPVTWHISAELAELDAEMPQVELVAAVRRGIEGWNDALGFEAFRTVVAGPDDSFADDDLNFVIFDPDPSLGYAFANWRTNPNTGEIRGASIYLGRGWILDDYFPLDPDTGTDPVDAQGAPDNHAQLLPPKQKQPVVQLTWDALPSKPLCVYWAPSYNAGAAEPAPETNLDNAAKIERYLTHVVAHEIGHTLSLRHNFKGSMVPPSSSVMDYADVDIRIATDQPGGYDIAAVKWLYGQSTDLPTDPFCTDGDYFYDPDCAVFDAGADPMLDFHLPQYDMILDYFLDFGLPPEYVEIYLPYYADGLLAYVRAGYRTSEALDAALGRVGAPLDPANAANPGYAAAADAITTWVLSYLYLTDEAERGYISTDPTDPAITTAVIEQAGQVLLNVDGARTVASRRTMVDLLKKLQTTEAYLALVDARSAIETEMAAAPAIDAALLADLLSRIDAAIEPYFD